MKIDWTTGDGTKRWIGSVKCKNVKRNYTITSILNYVEQIFYPVSKLYKQFLNENVLLKVDFWEYNIFCIKTRF